MRRFQLILAMVFLLTGCHRFCLSCRSEFLYPSYLASCRVNTPDPARAAFLGQQIIVSWNLEKNVKPLPIILCLNVRYGNQGIETFTIPIFKAKSWWTYRLLNEEYMCKQGIISFQAQLIQEGQILAEWSHFLWAEIIEVGAE